LIPLRPSCIATSPILDVLVAQDASHSWVWPPASGMLNPPWSSLMSGSAPLASMNSGNSGEKQSHDRVAQRERRWSHLTQDFVCKIQPTPHQSTVFSESVFKSFPQIASAARSRAQTIGHLWQTLFPFLLLLWQAFGFLRKWNSASGCLTSGQAGDCSGTRMTLASAPTRQQSSWTMI
jgi:hypothetical protein